MWRLYVRNAVAIGSRSPRGSDMEERSSVPAG